MTRKSIDELTNSPQPVTELSMADYQMLAHKTSKNTLVGHPVVYPTMGLTSEAGEVAGKVKKVFRDNDGIITEEIRQALIAELGGVFWYLAECATQIGATLDEIAINNIEELFSRKQRGVIEGSGDNR